MEWTQSREGDLGLGGTCAFVSCLHVCFACFQFSALLMSTVLFVAQGSCEYAPHPQPPYGAGGNTACAQAVVLARLLGLMHVCLHAYVVAYVCTYPSAVEKVSLAAASRCAT